MPCQHAFAAKYPDHLGAPSVPVRQGLLRVLCSQASVAVMRIAGGLSFNSLMNIGTRPFAGGPIRPSASRARLLANKGSLLTTARSGPMAGVPICPRAAIHSLAILMRGLGSPKVPDKHWDRRHRLGVQVPNDPYHPMQHPCSYYVDNGMFNSVDQFWQHCLGSFTKPPYLLDGKLLHVGIRMLDPPARI